MSGIEVLAAAAVFGGSIYFHSLAQNYAESVAEARIEGRSQQTFNDAQLYMHPSSYALTSDHSFPSQTVNPPIGDRGTGTTGVTGDDDDDDDDDDTGDTDDTRLKPKDDGYNKPPLFIPLGRPHLDPDGAIATTRPNLDDTTFVDPHFNDDFKDRYPTDFQDGAKNPNHDNDLSYYNIFGDRRDQEDDKERDQGASSEASQRAIKSIDFPGKLGYEVQPSGLDETPPNERPFEGHLLTGEEGELRVTAEVKARELEASVPRLQDELNDLEAHLTDLQERRQRQVEYLRQTGNDQATIDTIMETMQFDEDITATEGEIASAKTFLDTGLEEEVNRLRGLRQNNVEIVGQTMTDEQQFNLYRNYLELDDILPADTEPNAFQQTADVFEQFNLFNLALNEIESGGSYTEMMRTLQEGSGYTELGQDNAFDGGLKFDQAYRDAFRIAQARGTVPDNAVLYTPEELAYLEQSMSPTAAAAPSEVIGNEILEDFARIPRAQRDAFVRGLGQNMAQQQQRIVEGDFFVQDFGGMVDDPVTGLRPIDPNLDIAAGFDIDEGELGYDPFNPDAMDPSGYEEFQLDNDMKGLVDFHVNDTNLTADNLLPGQGGGASGRTIMGKVKGGMQGAINGVKNAPRNAVETVKSRAQFAYDNPGTTARMGTEMGAKMGTGMVAGIVGEKAADGICANDIEGGCDKHGHAAIASAVMAPTAALGNAGVDIASQALRGGLTLGSAGSVAAAGALEIPGLGAGAFVGMEITDLSEEGLANLVRQNQGGKELTLDQRGYVRTLANTLGGAAAGTTAVVTTAGVAGVGGAVLGTEAAGAGTLAAFVGAGGASLSFLGPAALLGAAGGAAIGLIIWVVDASNARRIELHNEQVESDGRAIAGRMSNKYETINLEDLQRNCDPDHPEYECDYVGGLTGAGRVRVEQDAANRYQQRESDFDNEVNTAVQNRLNNPSSNPFERDFNSMLRDIDTTTSAGANEAFDKMFEHNQYLESQQGNPELRGILPPPDPRIDRLAEEQLSTDADSVYARNRLIHRMTNTKEENIDEAMAAEAARGVGDPRDYGPEGAPRPPDTAGDPVGNYSRTYHSSRPYESRDGAPTLPGDGYEAAHTDINESALAPDQLVSGGYFDPIYTADESSADSRFNSQFPSGHGGAYGKP